MLENKAHSSLALILRACATAIGVAGFAILFSYSITEIYARTTGFELSILQELSFQFLQIVFAMFLIWPNRHLLLPKRINLALLLLCIGIGVGLGVYFSVDLRHWIGLGADQYPVVKMTTDQLVLGSAAAHFAAYILHTGFIAPLAENLIYRQLIFSEAEQSPVWAVAAGSLLTFALAYGFNGGLEGALFALQFGFVLTLLRVISRSVLYPVITHISYGVIIEAATLWRYLP